LSSIMTARPREAILEELHAQHKDDVFSFLVRLLGDRALAEDVLQEGFIAVYQNLDRYDPARPVRPWLFEIMRNAALMALRTRGRKERRERAAAKKEAGDHVPPAVTAREDVSRTQRALAELPVETRALLIQRHGLDMKLEELAKSFACSERTIRNRLERAAVEFARALFGLARPGGGGS
jgi:RNA polymerase sigma-70 factor (ECF subfamily)